MADTRKECGGERARESDGEKTVATRRDETRRGSGEKLRRRPNEWYKVNAYYAAPNLFIFFFYISLYDMSENLNFERIIAESK